jgi:hypothetical protein
MTPACPFCASIDIDQEFRTCRTCNTGLPTGSFDVRPRYRQGRAGLRATHVQLRATRSDKRTESITGGKP